MSPPWRISRISIITVTEVLIVVGATAIAAFSPGCCSFMGSDVWGTGRVLSMVTVEPRSAAQRSLVVPGMADIPM